VFKDRDGQRRIGTDVPYAERLQIGGGALNLPPRVFLGFSQEDEVMVKQIVQLRLSEITTN
jgi:phage gpG-like protein